MKKTIIIFLTFFFIFDASAQNKKYDKILKDIDIVEYVKNVPIGSYKEFWNSVVVNNKRMSEFKKAAEKNTPAFQAARKDMGEAQMFVQIAIESQRTYDLKKITDTLIAYTGANTIWPKLTLDIVADDSPNAYCYPEGQVFITGALLDATNCDFGQLLGVFAHECAHVLLFHHYTSAWAIQKKLITNTAVAASVAAVNAMANAYAQANGAVDNSSWDSVNRTTVQLANAAYDDAMHRFRYKYARGEEYEADVIAYRFLEWCGIGGESYINALETIAKDDDLYYGKDEDHPKTSDRVALLRYMASTYPMFQ